MISYRKSMKNNLEINRKFFDKWSAKYDSVIFQFWFRKFHQPIFEEVKKEFKILDISCGTGELLLRLAQKIAPSQLYGIDLSEEMIKCARKKLSKKVSLKIGDVHNLKFIDNSFDYVVSTEAFHHYADQNKALEEMRRVSKDKVTVVDVNFFFKTIHFLFEKMEPGCVKMNSKEEIRNLFEKVGLKNISQKRKFLFSIITSGHK
jgi:ubiquinone/menaquinone biosynthesis C-methylase UbiE